MLAMYNQKVKDDMEQKSGITSEEYSNPEYEQWEQQEREKLQKESEWRAL